MYTSTLLFLNIGTPELMVIMFVAILLFGGKKLPELARGLGKGIREFKDASDGVKREIHRNINAVNDEMDFEAKNNTAAGNTVPSTMIDNSADEFINQPSDYSIDNNDPADKDAAGDPPLYNTSENK